VRKGSSLAEESGVEMHMAGNDLKQHSLITIVFAFAASVVLVGSLRTWDEPSWWWLVAVVVLVAAGKIVGLNPRSMQPVIVAVAVVLLKAVEGWGLTTAAQTLIRSFAMYPHVYVVTAATALMCLMFDAEQIIAVRPATAMTIALSACLIPGRTAEDLVLTAVVMVVLPVVASLSRVRRMHRFVLLAYAVTEPIIVAAVLWVMTIRGPVPWKGAAGIASEGRGPLGFGEFEFIVALLPAAVTLVCGVGAALRDRVPRLDMAAEPKKL